MRHGKKLGFTKPVLHRFVEVVIAEMGHAYPELVSGRDAIVRTVRSEEERFDAVLTSGLLADLGSGRGSLFRNVRPRRTSSPAISAGRNTRSTQPVSMA